MLALLIILTVLFAGEVSEWAYRASKISNGKYIKEYKSWEPIVNALFSCAMVAALIVAIVYWL